MPSDILIIPNRNSTTAAPVMLFSGSQGNSIRMEVLTSGSIAFLGKSGSLFSISDNLSGSLMAVNDISGLPILEVFSDDKVVMGRFNTNALVVTGSNVGIRKAAPLVPLDISGSVFISGSLSTTSNASIAAGAITFDNTTATFNTSNTNINSSTIVVGNDSTDVVGIANNTMYFNGTGNVAIGKTTPVSAKLDVNGNVIISGSLIVSGSDAFIQDGTQRIRVGRGAGTHTWVFTNTALGTSVLQSNSSGEYNTGIGWFACGSITSGLGNTVVGGNSGNSISTANGNTFLGAYVSPSGTGASNTFVGYTAGYEHTTGTFNVFIGLGAGRGITTGNSNVVIGAVTGLASSLSSTIIIADGGGTIRQYINSSGNTGFGTTNPGYKIHAYTNSETTIAVETASRKWGILTNTSWSSNGFSIYDLTADSSRFLISTTGNVGIGTNTPNSVLDVNGKTIISGSLIVTGDVQADFTPMFLLMGA